MKLAAPRLLVVGALVLRAAATLFAASWSDTDLAKPGAADKLIAEASASKSASDACALLDKYAPRLPSGPDKRRAFAALAQLRELSGSFSLAASAWSAASAAEEGVRDDLCLLAAARCLIAVGETEQADASIRIVLLTGKNEAALARARLLSTYLSAFRRDSGAVALLKSFAVDPAYAADRPTVLFLLSRIFSDDSARTQLLADFPSSPEAAVLLGKNVSIASLPLWLLPSAGAVAGVQTSPLPSAESPKNESRTPPGANAAASSKASSKSVTTSAAAATSPAAGEAKRPATVDPVALQVGLFKLEKNARALSDRLKGKGFSASVAPRAVGGTDYWAVTVAPGKSADETMMRLKDAGFESYPLF